MEVSTKNTAGKQTYSGKIKSVSVLNKSGATKETYHIEVVGDVPLDYLPGDIVGFYPKNPESDLQVIARWLGNEEVKKLLEDKNIRRLIKSTLNQLSTILGISIEEDKADLVDVAEKYPVTNSVDIVALAEIFRPITPRLYSISSSPDAHHGELHVTVTLNTFEIDGKKKNGLASYYLGHLTPNTPLSFFIQKKAHFKLPSNDIDVIMIGPGVGLAPFRGFLAHRSFVRASGRNWLFFGEQHKQTDFYYEEEIKTWQAEGILTKLDTAFSRDQEYKIYVQDKIRENQKEFVSWLDTGAYLYICGQRKPMSVDVEEVIIQALAEQKGWTLPEAKAFLKSLEKEGRYSKDVY